MSVLKTREQAAANGAPTHYKARRCLLCGSGDLFLALPLAHSAIGNDYLPTGLGPVLAMVAAALLGGTVRWRRDPRSS